MQFVITTTSALYHIKGIEEPPCPAEGSYLEDGEWFIDVHSLEDIIGISLKYGKIVLHTEEDVPVIEIVGNSY